MPTRPLVRGLARPVGQLVDLRPVVVLALVALVLVVDLVLARVALPRVVFGLLDELGHLTTTWLLLAAWAVAARRPWRPSVVAGALVASVLIDLDHAPLELIGDEVLMRGGSRPVTHSLLTVLVLLAASTLTRGRWRAVLGGAGLGVSLHLWRDLASAPVPLLWPAAPEVLLGPVPVWVSLVVAALVLVRPGRGAAVSGRP